MNLMVCPEKDTAVGKVPSAIGYSCRQNLIRPKGIVKININSVTYSSSWLQQPLLKSAPYNRNTLQLVATFSLLLLFCAV